MKAGHHTAAREIAPAERHRKQEPQGRDCGVDGGDTNAALMLVNLETADIVGGRCIRRAPEESREGTEVADVILAGM